MCIRDSPWARKIVDETIIWATTMEELQDRIYTVLTRCRDSRITISRKKLQVGSSIHFAGHIIADTGIRPDKAKYQANARRRIANELHKAHSGLTKMMKTATQLYYWPNMRTLLEAVVQKCTTCQKDRPTQARMKMKETLPSDALIP